jgi:hypothetical protein
LKQFMSGPNEPKQQKPNSRGRTHEVPIVLLPEMRRTHWLARSSYAVS